MSKDPTLTCPTAASTTSGPTTATTLSGCGRSRASTIQRTSSTSSRAFPHEWRVIADKQQGTTEHTGAQTWVKACREEREAPMLEDREPTRDDASEVQEPTA